MGFEPPSDLPQPTYQVMQAWEANDFVEHMSNIENYLKFEMKWAQAIYKESINQNQNSVFVY